MIPNKQAARRRLETKRRAVENLASDPDPWSTEPDPWATNPYTWTTEPHRWISQPEPDTWVTDFPALGTSTPVPPGKAASVIQQAPTTSTTLLGK